MNLKEFSFINSKIKNEKFIIKYIKNDLIDARWNKFVNKLQNVKQKKKKQLIE